MRGYIYLFISILFEIAGSACLKLSDGFTNWLPSSLLILFYGCSFVFIVFALKTVSLSVGYSIWAGLGTAGAALVGIIVFSEALSDLNIIGLIIIVAGVVLMNSGKKEDEATQAAEPS